MLIKILRLILAVILGLSGFFIAGQLYNNFLYQSMPDLQMMVKVLGIGCGALLGYFLTPTVVLKIRKLLDWLLGMLYKTPTGDLLGGSFGLIIGLIIAALLANSLYSIPYAGAFLPILVSLLLGYVGMIFGAKKRDEILGLLTAVPKLGSKSNKVEIKEQHYIILDTSVIIDGRIADIIKTGFIQGILLIPNFVLAELRHIADSEDSLKRNRGRRGLDILNKLRQEGDSKVHFYEEDVPEANEVDTKLLKLAQILNGEVLTNDFNLNKVAALIGVKVLNINDLANALKPVVLPGEEMHVKIIQEGKEANQGVAYLDDGTMIVVENGKKNVGVDLDVVVTSVLQTSAGRMIFAKAKGQLKNGNGKNHNLNPERSE